MKGVKPMMSKQVQVEMSDYKKVLKEVRDIPINTDTWFPPLVADWIEYNATLLGVSHTYMSYPLITAVSYCAQHATVKLEDDMHSEPVLTYSLIAGRSGTNKSASMKKIIELITSIKNPNGDHGFDTGTLEGLMKSMKENNNCVISANDEFANFYESLEKGSNSNFEKSRFLSLYSCISWSKKTKSNGSFQMEDPRFNFVAFTQPLYAANFARNNVSDGFFQRFMISIPAEVFVTRKEKKKMKTENSNKNRLDMQKVLSCIYEMGIQEDIVMTLSPEAEELYDNYHDSVIEYRKNDIYEEKRVSVMSKSVGLVMRLSGVICLLRSAIMKISSSPEQEENSNENNVNGQSQSSADEHEINETEQSFSENDNVNENEQETNFIVTKNDFIMAQNVTEYSVNSSLALLSDENTSHKMKKGESRIAIPKRPVPEPENFTMEYAMANQKIVKKYLTTPSVPMSLVSRDKIYPIVQNMTGKHIGAKFVNGLKNLGLGLVSPNSNSFKRFNIDDENCPDRDNLRKKYKLLNMSVD